MQLKIEEQINFFCDFEKLIFQVAMVKIILIEIFIVRWAPVIITDFCTQIWKQIGVEKSTTLAETDSHFMQVSC